MIVKRIFSGRLAGAAMAFVLTLSVVLAPVNVEKAHAFDFLNPPQPGAADGWYVTKSGRYQDTDKPLWESEYEYELNDAGQVVKKIETYPAEPDSASTTYYEYDSEGRVSRYTTVDNEYHSNYQYAYDYKDDGSIVTTETWDYLNGDGETETWTNIRTYSPTDGWWYRGEWHFEYDEKGRLIHRWCDTYETVSDWVYTYEEDGQGRTIKGTIIGDNADFERLFTYTEDGGYTMRESSETGYEEFSYNGAGQLTTYVFGYDEEPMYFDYIYDEAGNNTKILVRDTTRFWAYEYIQLTEPDDPADTPVSFVDVPENAYYAEAVQWAVDKDITNGLDATQFGPNETCTRAQMVTFLWRAAGKPEPTLTANPFTDVRVDAYYYNAVLWAVEQGITTGTSETTFSPNDKVIREQTVTFLWRKAGKPDAGSVNPFEDVPAGAYYTSAVLWAVKEGITNGVDATHFGPKNPCTRGQIVTFLFRAE